MDPSGKAILAATSKRSGADGSIASAVGCMTRFDINSLNLDRSRQSFGFHAQIAGLVRSVATYIIIARLRELGTNLPGRSLSQIFARKGQAILTRSRERGRRTPTRRAQRHGSSARSPDLSQNGGFLVQHPIRRWPLPRNPLYTREARGIKPETRSL